jgi:hypothetical protein
VGDTVVTKDRCRFRPIFMFLPLTIKPAKATIAIRAIIFNRSELGLGIKSCRAAGILDFHVNVVYSPANAWQEFSAIHGRLKNTWQIKNTSKNFNRTYLTWF